MAATASHGHHHEHGGLGWRAGLLLAWALVEIGYGTSSNDPLILANGTHDLFDVAFTAAVIYSEHRSIQLLRSHWLRHTAGPLFIVILSVAILAFALIEFAWGGEASARNGLSIVILLISGVLSLNVALGGRRRGQRTLSLLMTAHFFKEDVPGTLAGALAAGLNLYFELTWLRQLATLLILTLTTWIGYRIIRNTTALIHLERNCKPGGPGH